MNHDTSNIRCLSKIVIAIIFIIAGLFVLIYSVFYLLGLVHPIELPTFDWWTALSIIVALTIAVLVLTVFRERALVESYENMSTKYDNVDKRLKKIDEQFKQVEHISSLTTALIDISSNEISDEEKWNHTYNKIEQLFNLELIRSDDAYNLSLLAWKNGYRDICFKLRVLASKKNTNFKNNVLLYNFINYYLYHPEGHTVKGQYIDIYYNPKQFLQQLNINPINYYFDYEKIPDIESNDVKTTYATAARYMFAQKEYAVSRLLFDKASNINGAEFQRWYFANILLIDIAQSNFEKLEGDLQFARLQPSWTGSTMYLLFDNFIENILRVYNHQECIYLDLSIYIDLLSLDRFSYFSTWNMYDVISNLKLRKSQIEGMQLVYYSFYIFVSGEDITLYEAFPEMNRDVEKQKFLQERIDYFVND